MSTTLTPLPAMPPTTRRVRAYFAPVNRATQTPTVFDPSVSGHFSLDAPPAPWIDLGWIEEFARKSLSKTGTLVTGSPGITQYQVRESVDASVSFRFKTWSKLTMALSAGSQHMNLLAPAAGATQSPSGSKAAAAVALAATGSTATFLAMSSTAGFEAGDVVAVDADYAGQTGFVGTGVAAAYVQSAAGVNDDVDYIRRVTFNLARVTQAATGGLQLASALIDGAPTSTMKVQKVLGFVDREGGNFFQEWSGLFVMPGEQGERILFYYPRLQAMAGASETASTLAEPLERIALNASLRALPVMDANDAQAVVCFRSYLPSAMTLV